MAVFGVLTSSAKVDEDFAIWPAFNLKKSITEDFWVTGSTEYWTMDSLKTMDLWYARIMATYRVAKWMNASVAYDYMLTHAPEGVSHMDCQPKNNVLVQSTFIVPVSDFRFFLRQRYTRYRISSCNGQDRYYANMLRTRLLVRYDIPDCRFSPFVSDEIFYWRKFAQNWADIGCFVKIDKHSSFKLFYRRRSKFNPDHRNSNIIGIDYTFSF